MRNQAGPDRAAPLHSLRKFARDLEVPEEFAIAVYELELQRLADGARVVQFMSIRAEKHAKEALRARRHEPLFPVSLVLKDPPVRYSTTPASVHVAVHPSFLTFKSAVAGDSSRVRMHDRQAMTALIDGPATSMGSVPVF